MPRMRKTRVRLLGILFLGLLIPTYVCAAPMTLTSPQTTLQISNMPTTETKLTLVNDKLRIENLMEEDMFKYVIAKLTLIGSTNKEVLTKDAQRVDTQAYDVQLVIPPIEDGSYSLTLYSCIERYGTYRAFLDNIVGIEVKNGKASFKTTSGYSHNFKITNSYRLTEDMYVPETTKEEDLKVLTTLAHKITTGAKDDYEKALKVHDWVANYIYYDYDAHTDTNSLSIDAIDVYRSRQSICVGYADLYKELMRILDIPCKTVTGVALSEGVRKEWDSTNSTSINHIWNEVYVNNRWVIVDTTWDSPNSVKDGKKTTTGKVSHMYFDTTLKVFSMDHLLVPLNEVTSSSLNQVN